MAKCGGTGRGSSCRRQHGGRKPSLLLSLESGYDAARHCWAWYCVVRKGVAGLQLQTAAQGISVPSAALKESRLGMAWIGRLRTGDVGRGEVIAADGSTEPAMAPCCSLWRADEVWSGAARNGDARQGEVWLGKRRGRFSVLSTQRPSQICNVLTGPARAVLCFQTPHRHARLFCCCSILCYFLRHEPNHWRQYYQHSNSGKRRISLQQVHSATPTKILRHHAFRL